MESPWEGKRQKVEFFFLNVTGVDPDPTNEWIPEMHPSLWPSEQFEDDQQGFQDDELRETPEYV